MSDVVLDTMTSPAAKPVAYVLVGLPGSGKSSWAKTHPERLPIASTDAFIESYAHANGLTYAEAFHQFNVQAKSLLKDRLRQLITQKISFIWDQTNITSRKRRAVYAKLHPTHQVVFVCFCVPVEVCVERVELRQRQAGEVINRERILHWSTIATFPEPGEPYDAIIPVVHPSLRKR